jgi:hypothetical protein
MCTVSWIHQRDGYQLLCNRDEKRTRKPAAPPEVHVADGVRYIAPSDGDFGGTWIATNEFGVSLCLLNGNSCKPVADPKSRGRLVLELSNSGTAWEVGQRMIGMNLTCYPPFTIAALEPRKPAMVVEWDGVELGITTDGDAFMPLVSSSYDPPGVRLRRMRDFRRRASMAGTVDEKMLFFFHESHGSRADAYSPCMHRADAETVSFSWIRVNESKVDFFYSPGAPCEWKPGHHLVLERTCSN